MMRSFRLINCMIVMLMTSGMAIAQAPIPDLCNARDSLGLYNINIDIYTYHFSGLLLLKRINDSTIRLVMNSEMGPKLLDMVLFPSGYKLLYAFHKLNHKRTVRTLYEDFGALSGILTYKQPFKVENILNASYYTFDLSKRMKIIYTVDLLSHGPILGRFEEGKTVKSTFDYFFEQGTTQIISIKLEHQHFKMVISLNKI